MPETDTLLKLLVQTFAVDLSAWRLDTPDIILHKGDAVTSFIIHNSSPSTRRS